MWTLVHSRTPQHNLAFTTTEPPEVPEDNTALPTYSATQSPRERHHPAYLQRCLESRRTAPLHLLDFWRMASCRLSTALPGVPENGTTPPTYRATWISGGCRYVHVAHTVAPVWFLVRLTCSVSLPTCNCYTHCIYKETHTH